MPSNAWTKKRVLNRRPTVCKSDKPKPHPGDNMTCDFQIASPVQATLSTACTLVATDPDAGPFDEIAVEVPNNGGFYDGPPTVFNGVPILTTWTAGPDPGDYVVTAKFTSPTGAICLSSDDVHVDPFP